MRACLSLIGGLALVFSWETAGNGQIAVFFNKVFVGYRGAPASDGHNICEDDLLAGGPIGDTANKSVSFWGANRIGTDRPARIEYSPQTTNAFTNPGGNFPYPGSCLSLCVQLGYNNEIGSNVPIDSMVLEVFKFAPGSNPFDSGSTPPLRTFTFAAIGEMSGANCLCGNCSGMTGPECRNNFPLGFKPEPSKGSLPAGENGRCVGWDGSYNVEGEFARTNGNFGFRVTARTNRQHPTQGNIAIETAPPGVYPSVENGRLQEPISVDVVDIHVVRTTPTVVGVRPSIAVQPYNLRYRLSKDSVVTMKVLRCTSGGSCGTTVRTVIDNIPRVGEGIPSGTLTNGDFWDGRNDDGDLLRPGNYLVQIEAAANDEGGADSSVVQTRQISLDPLQITDISLQPLLDLSTSLATINYLLTEDATVYVDIYPPDTNFEGDDTTNFTAGIEHNFNVQEPNSNCLLNEDGFTPSSGVRLPSSCLDPEDQDEVDVVPLRALREQKRSRTPVLSFWDGRDREGRVVPDGNYVFALYAAVPSEDGPGGGTTAWPMSSIFTAETKQGVLSVSRGLPGVSQITPRTSVMGSTPAVAGLDPFLFSYSLTRDAFVTLTVKDPTQNPPTVVKSIVNGETRQPSFSNVERWSDGTDDNGRLMKSGSYLAELEVKDPFDATKVVRVTASFPVNLLRVTDVLDTALLSGATDRIFLSYQLSRPMEVTWSIFQPGSRIDWQDAADPPCQSVLPGLSTGGCVNVRDSLNNVTTPVFQVSNFRPGRPLRVTESWDGRDADGLLMADGVYPFTVVAKSTEAVQAGMTPFASDRIMGTVTISRGPTTFKAFGVVPTVAQVFNSSEVVTLPPFEIDFALTRTSSVTVEVLSNEAPPIVVKTVVPGSVVFPDVLNREFWDGRDETGNFVRSGFYTMRVIASDVAAQIIQPTTFQQTISVDPLVIYDIATSPITFDASDAQISYQVSESMKVAIKVYKPGTRFDVNGNPIPAEKFSLVRSIVGIKPARTVVNDFWDGKDNQLTLAPDGNYMFKIYASTDITSIDSITGDIRPGAPLAEGSFVSELPVTRGASADAETEFRKNTIIYPNPITTANATIRIRVPLRARLSMRILNLAGDLIREEEFGEKPPDSYYDFTWKKDNASGRKVAPGVYFVVFREEGTSGDRTLFQWVKKVIVP